MKICTVCERPKKRFYKGNNSCVDCFKERRYKHRRENPELRLLCSARHRAKKEGVPFALSLKDIEVPLLCPVLGIKLKYNFGVGGVKDNSPSIDRNIPKIGYIKSNISIISWRANRIKNNATLDEIEKLYNWLKTSCEAQQ